MSFMDIYLIVPSAFASGMIWFVLLAVLLYIARDPAHQAIRSLSRVIHNSMRLSASAVARSERWMLQRNKDVLLAQGREAAERMIEREFERIDATVRRDLAEYPALHRQLSEEATRLDEDYQSSVEVPPAPPGWIKAVEAVAKIPAKGDPVVSNILEDIHVSLEKASDDAMEQCRKSSRERHQILKGMLPHWRRVSQRLSQVNKNVDSLLLRSKSIDRHMEEYENIVQGTNQAVRTLSSSSITQFFVSAFVLAIAVGGAAINFNLIATPMAEMVGGTSRIMGYSVASIAAMVIILVEIAMGLFLMEALRITRLFPVIGALDDKLRRGILWAAFIFLFSLAGIEAGLAYMRELLMQDAAATRALLRADGATEIVQNSHLWITTAAQMGMGFILPFALTFVAIPLESFVHSLRTVLGVLAVSILRTVMWSLRLLGNLARFTGRLLINVYDLLIFAPLWVEQLIKTSGKRKAEAVDDMAEPETVSPLARESA
ncbi:MAG TPA: hypothetical protein ENK04_14935 [Gammaproteobacteria bacterium]|nr:hypothetical protein [Gammaproteobacteria bacterium]